MQLSLVYYLALWFSWDLATAQAKQKLVVSFHCPTQQSFYDLGDN